MLIQTLSRPNRPPGGTDHASGLPVIITGIVPVVWFPVQYDPAPLGIVEALEAGADEYVMKPFTKDVLQEKIGLLADHAQNTCPCCR